MKKTKLLVKRDAQTLPWVTLDTKHIAEKIRQTMELLSRAALLQCRECGELGCLVYKDKIIPICTSCALKKIQQLLDDEDQ